jgi:trehalose 6-phosphate synthase
MSRLVAVSNRVGSIRGAPLAGGLAVALVDALREKNGLWFGWSGKTAEQVDDDAPALVREGEVAIATVDLSQEDHDAYYAGFANRCLWPLCHFRLDLTGYDRAHFEAYQRVNRRFAKALMPLLRPDDVIWAHDYHLFPMAHELRRLGAKQRIGFFLHIPFPPRELLTTLPQHKTLVRALFEYDLVGFQIVDDVKRLAAYVQEDLGGKVGDGWMEAFGRRLTRSSASTGSITARAWCGAWPPTS